MFSKLARFSHIIEPSILKIRPNIRRSLLRFTSDKPSEKSKCGYIQKKVGSGGGGGGGGVGGSKTSKSLNECGESTKKISCPGVSALGGVEIWYCKGRSGRRRTALWTSDTLMMHKEVWPILAVIAFAVFGFCFMVTWISSTRDDVSYWPGHPPLSDRIDLLHPPKRKLLVVVQKYKPMPELDKLFKDMKVKRK